MASNIQWIARAGYTARATVFFLVGGLALFSGISGGKSDTKSALDTLLQQPFGRMWVGIIAIGLLGFVAWRLAQSVGNADHLPHDLKGMAIRAALFGSALVYIGLAYYALEHALASAASDGGGTEKGLAQWAMSQPFGKYLAGAIGIGFIIGGCVTIAKGVLRKYERYQSAEARRSRPVSFICVYGLSARGILFVIVGGFFVYAAFTVDPHQAGSIADALNWIRSLPFGGVLYTIVAVGLASFGAYNLIQARCRVVHNPELRAEARTAKETLRRAH
jgi:hypothetical protein